MIQCAWGLQVEPGLFRVFDQEPVAGESAHDAPDEPIEETLEAVRVRRTDAMQSWSVLLQRIYG